MQLPTSMRRCPWQPLVQTLQDAFVAGAQVPLRHAHALATEHSLLLMPACRSQSFHTVWVTMHRCWTA